MSFLKSYPVAIVLFSLLIVSLYAVASQNMGFWHTYGYTPTGNVTSFNKIDEMNAEAIKLSCDINPEQDSCAGIKKIPFLDNFVGRMVTGAYGAAVTLYKSFSIPKVLIIETLGTLGIPTIFITAGYTILLLVLILSIILLIFNRSDSG